MKVIYVTDKMWKARIKSFEHVKKRCTETPVRRCERLMLEVRGEVELGCRSIGARRGDQPGPDLREL